MIPNLQFWRNWPLSLKLALLLFSALALILFCLTAFWFFNDLHNTLHWDVATELNKKFIATEAFVEKGLRFTNNELIYYLKEWYLPSNAFINQKASWVLFGSVIIGMSLISTGLSFQNGFWFLGSLVLVAGFLVLSRTEIVFQTTDNLPFIAAFLSIGILLFIFNSFLKKAGFWLRFLSILAAFLLLVAVAINFSKVNLPIMALSGYGLLFAILVFVVFVFLTAHEIIVALIWTVAQSSEKGKSSFLTYLGISIIYLLNCLLIYLENIKAIDSSFMVVSPLILFAISAILGFWGFKKQCDDLGFFSFQRSGAWVYLGLAVISISLVGFVYATSNDPLIELINDYIAIAHFSMGMVFFGHVILNFIGLFQKGLNAYLVLYKPKFSSLLLAKILGVFLVGFFLIQKNIYAYNQLRAGLNNAIADFYLAEGEPNAAETYYKESVNYDFYNHKANYALAGMARNVGDGVTAAYFYRQAIQKNPSEFAYLGLSQHLESEDMYFDALFTLKEALVKFPESSVLASNTAHLLEKANARDSVYFYLDKALQNCRNCKTEKVNLQAFWIENALETKLDSVSSDLQDKTYSANLANQLAISRMTGKIYGQLNALPKNTSLNTAQFATIYNQFNLPENTLLVSDTIWDSFINNEANISLNEDLRFVKAVQEFQKEEKITAIKQLTYLAQDSTETGLMYRRTLGMWYLKEGLFSRAVSFFRAAGDGASAQFLIDNDFESHLKLKQLQQAGELSQIGVNENTYQDIGKKAPFNPFIIKDVANYLSENGKVLEAYNLVFDALEFNENDVELWKKYVFLALNNGVADYAENGLAKLKQLMKPNEYTEFRASYFAERELLLKKQRDFAQ